VAHGDRPLERDREAEVQVVLHGIVEIEPMRKSVFSGSTGTGSSPLAPVSAQP
jgi:hypothetical protein